MSLARLAAVTMLAAAGSAPLPFRLAPGDWATPAADVDIAPKPRQSLESAVEKLLPRRERGCFFYALVDLDADELNELLVHVRAPLTCGDAGCPLVLMRWKGNRLVRFSRTELVRNVGITPWTGKGLRPLIVAQWGGEYREMRPKGGRYPEWAEGSQAPALSQLPEDVKQVPWFAAATCGPEDLK